MCRVWSLKIHSLFDLPSSYDDIEMCEFQYGYDLEIVVTPEIIVTDPALRSVEPSKRNCYFDGEKKLKFFKVYSRRNCEMECEAEYYLKNEDLECVPFYMVRDNSTRVCDHRHEAFQRFDKFYFDRDEDAVRSVCGCLERCDLIDYSFEIFGLSRNDYNESLDWVRAPIDMTVTVRFNEDDVIPMRRYQKWTFVEFLAQSGGLMGLFAGISALSVIEVVYFFTLRLVSSLFGCGGVK